jgi:hypothetical protein
MGILPNVFGSIPKGSEPPVRSAAQASGVESVAGSGPS